MPAFAIRVAHVEVRRDRIVADVCVSEERFVRTTPRLIALLLSQYPHLLEHCCVNDRGATFAAVAASTSMPHLLEHMSIENQVRLEWGRDADSPARGLYVGKTRWIDRAARLARIEMSYADDLVALAALRDATRDLDEALIGRSGVIRPSR